MQTEYDPDAAYDSIQSAISRESWVELSNLVAELKNWTFTDAAQDYGHSALTSLRSYCDTLVLAYGHRATAQESASH